MENTIKINRLIKSKRSRINILRSGAEQSYTGYISVNNAVAYKQKILPEITENVKDFNITDIESYHKLFKETDFISVKKFPYDITVGYNGKNARSFYVSQNDYGDIDVYMYDTRYIKPLKKFKTLYVGNSQSKPLYALDDNYNILAVIMPYRFEDEEILVNFIKDWFVKNIELPVDFPTDLTSVNGWILDYSGGLKLIIPEQQAV